MPSILTHYGFNKEVLDNSINFLCNNEDVYLVGAQGPDPFFFYGIVPFLKSKNGKEIRNYGIKLHKLVPSDVFYFFFNYANSSEHKDVLYAYILGAGLHYILDRKIHPYVFYKTGFSDDKKMKKRYFADHTLFETNLDVLLMNDRYKKYKVTTFESIKCDENKIEEVSDMYEKLAKEVLKDNNIDDDSFEDSYRQMVQIEKILYSKKGIKKGIVSCLFKNTPFNTMMHPRVVKDDYKIDYLNLDKSEWKDPSLEISYNKSVIDLIEESKVEAKEWIKIVKKFYDEEGDKTLIDKFSKGLIYDGYDLSGKMKVFESVYKRKENK